MSSSSLQLTGTLCMLYFLQGIPYGVQAKALPLYYHNVLGYTIMSVTKLYLLMTPWIFLKPIAGYFIKSQKDAKSAILVGLVVNFVVNSLLFFPSPKSYWGNIFVLFALFFVNCLVVLIDAATDLLAISSANSTNDIKHLSVANLIQIVSYKCGAIFGGSTLVILGFNNLHSMFLIVGIIYLFAALTFRIFYSSETHNSPHIESTEPNTTSSIYKLISTLSVQGTTPLLVFVFIYKFGEIASGSLYPILLTQQKLSSENVTFLTSIISEVLSLLGSFSGGFFWSAVKPVSPIQMLVKYLLSLSVLRVIPLALQVVSINYSANLFPMAILSTSMLSYFGGCVSTLTFTLMMSVSCKAPDNLKGFHYSIVSAFEVCGKLFFASFAGTMFNCFGLNKSYFLFCAFTFIASSVLFVSRNKFILKPKEQ
uniref:major facilitator superfamily domain-containing protein 3 isoform X1 n=1 Tax=Ciona intestinalis TaxID=7719 RepID=UPI0002B8E0C5|nr:major facilitator superfamily domain-containing protein 3 isoform X1 [Ciona intestinalis]|eukprot:XP_002128913.2 major facilitator superfamily domain-containing protein 3 isoform X1 [Ciona intestinalis]